MAGDKVADVAPEGGKKAKTQQQLGELGKEILHGVQAGNDNAMPRAANENVAEKKDLTPKQKDLVEKLKAARNARVRVDVFATAMDDLGLDAAVSALIPEAGDAGSSVISGLYMLAEAKKAGLDYSSYLKIVSLQAADCAVGLVPVAGDIVDYFFKANKWSANDFKKNQDKIVAEAKKAGVPEEQIAKITGAGDKASLVVKRAVSIYKVAKGKDQEKEAAPENPTAKAA